MVTYHMFSRFMMYFCPHSERVKVRFCCMQVKTGTLYKKHVLMKLVYNVDVICCK